MKALGEIGAPIDLVKPVLEEIGGDGESNLGRAAQKAIEKLADGDGQGSSDPSSARGYTKPPAHWNERLVPGLLWSN